MTRAAATSSNCGEDATVSNDPIDAAITKCYPQQRSVIFRSSGEILAAIRWSTIRASEQAIALCNGIKQELAAAVFSNFTQLTEDFLHRAKAGILKVIGARSSVGNLSRLRWYYLFGATSTFRASFGTTSVLSSSRKFGIWPCKSITLLSTITDVRAQSWNAQGAYRDGSITSPSRASSAATTHFAEIAV